MLIVAGRVVDPERLAAICHTYGVELLELFGSAASDTAGPTSDVDILYTLQPGRTLGWEIDDLADELSELFGRPVDAIAQIQQLAADITLDELDELRAALAALAADD